VVVKGHINWDLIAFDRGYQRLSRLERGENKHQISKSEGCSYSTVYQSAKRYAQLLSQGWVSCLYCGLTFNPSDLCDHLNDKIPNVARTRRGNPMDLNIRKTFSGTELKNQTGMFLESVLRGPTAISKNSRTIAVAVPVDIYEDLIARWNETQKVSSSSNDTGGK
jgi:hypothetical protein